MKYLPSLIILLFIYSCEKGTSSEALSTANPLYPVVFSVNVNADSSIVQWTKKNSFDHGTDTLVGRDSLMWSAIYNNGSEIHLKISAINGKAELSIYRYHDSLHQELVASAADSNATVSLEIQYHIPE